MILMTPDAIREANKKTTYPLLMKIRRDEGRPMHHYYGPNAYKRFESLKECGLVNVLEDVSNGKLVYRVYLTDKGRAVLEMLDEVRKCGEGTEWYHRRYQM